MGIRQRTNRLPVLLALLLSTLAACGGGGGGSSIPAFNLPYSIALGDFNGDGSMDLAVAITFIAGPPPHPGAASIILQNRLSPGNFFTGTSFATGTDAVGITTADLNADGKLDLVVASNTSATISVLLQDPVNPGRFRAAASLGTGGLPVDVAIGDLNADGKPDLAVATGAQNIVILLQDPANAGQFLPASNVPAGAAVTAVAIADVNADGRQDLVIAALDGSGNGRVSVLLQNPALAGSFLARLDLPAGAQPISVRVSDLNGDALPDIVVANLGTPSTAAGSGASVLLQDAANPGSFLPLVSYATDTRGIQIAVGDLNADGRPDLVVANSGNLSNTGSVSVLLQSAGTPGTFLPAVNRAGIARPNAIAIGDLNGDGKPDIAVADTSTASILFQSAGVAGSFLAPVQVGQ